MSASLSATYEFPEYSTRTGFWDNWYPNVIVNHENQLMILGVHNRYALPGKSNEHGDDDNIYKLSEHHKKWIKTGIFPFIEHNRLNWMSQTDTFNNNKDFILTDVSNRKCISHYVGSMDKLEMTSLEDTSHYGRHAFSIIKDRSLLIITGWRKNEDKFTVSVINLKENRIIQKMCLSQESDSSLFIKSTRSKRKDQLRYDYAQHSQIVRKINNQLQNIYDIILFTISHNGNSTLISKLYFQYDVSRNLIKLISKNCTNHKIAHLSNLKTPQTTKGVSISFTDINCQISHQSTIFMETCSHCDTIQGKFEQIEYKLNLVLYNVDTNKLKRIYTFEFDVQSPYSFSKFLCHNNKLHCFGSLFKNGENTKAIHIELTLNIPDDDYKECKENDVFTTQEAASKPADIKLINVKRFRIDLKALKPSKYKTFDDSNNNVNINGNDIIYDEGTFIDDIDKDYKKVHLESVIHPILILNSRNELLIFGSQKNNYIYKFTKSNQWINTLKQLPFTPINRCAYATFNDNKSIIIIQYDGGYPFKWIGEIDKPENITSSPLQSVYPTRCMLNIIGNKTPFVAFSGGSKNYFHVSVTNNLNMTTNKTKHNICACLPMSDHIQLIKQVDEYKFQVILIGSLNGGINTNLTKEYEVPSVFTYDTKRNVLEQTQSHENDVIDISNIKLSEYSDGYVDFSYYQLNDEHIIFVGGKRYECRNMYPTTCTTKDSSVKEVFIYSLKTHMKQTIYKLENEHFHSSIVHSGNTLYIVGNNDLLVLELSNIPKKAVYKFNDNYNDHHNQQRGRGIKWRARGQKQGRGRDYNNNWRRGRDRGGARGRGGYYNDNRKSGRGKWRGKGRGRWKGKRGGKGRNVNNSNIETIQSWLKSFLPQRVNADNYAKLFIQNGFENLQMIAYIDDRKTLNDIGIKLMGHQHIIFAEIKKLQK